LGGKIQFPICSNHQRRSNIKPPNPIAHLFSNAKKGNKSHRD
jgi:hypothetical protein